MYKVGQFSQHSARPLSLDDLYSQLTNQQNLLRDQSQSQHSVVCTAYGSASTYGRGNIYGTGTVYGTTSSPTYNTTTTTKYRTDPVYESSTTTGKRDSRPTSDSVNDASIDSAFEDLLNFDTDDSPNPVSEALSALDEVDFVYEDSPQKKPPPKLSYLSTSHNFAIPQYRKHSAPAQRPHIKTQTVIKSAPANVSGYRDSTGGLLSPHSNNKSSHRTSTSDISSRRPIYKENRKSTSSLQPRSQSHSDVHHDSTHTNGSSRWLADYRGLHPLRRPLSKPTIDDALSRCDFLNPPVITPPTPSSAEDERIDPSKLMNPEFLWSAVEIETNTDGFWSQRTRSTHSDRKDFFFSGDNSTWVKYARPEEKTPEINQSWKDYANRSPRHRNISSSVLQPSNQQNNQQNDALKKNSAPSRMYTSPYNTSYNKLNAQNSSKTVNGKLEPSFKNKLKPNIADTIVKLESKVEGDATIRENAQSSISGNLISCANSTTKTEAVHSVLDTDNTNQENYDNISNSESANSKIIVSSLPETSSNQQILPVVSKSDATTVESPVVVLESRSLCFSTENQVSPVSDISLESPDIQVSVIKGDSRSTSIDTKSRPIPISPFASDSIPPLSSSSLKGREFDHKAFTYANEHYSNNISNTASNSSVSQPVGTNDRSVGAINRSPGAIDRSPGAIDRSTGAINGPLGGARPKVKDNSTLTNSLCNSLILESGSETKMSCNPSTQNVDTLQDLLESLETYQLTESSNQQRPLRSASYKVIRTPFMQYGGGDPVGVESKVTRIQTHTLTQFQMPPDIQVPPPTGPIIADLQSSSISSTPKKSERTSLTSRPPQKGTKKSPLTRAHSLPSQPSPYQPKTSQKPTLTLGHNTSLDISEEFTSATDYLADGSVENSEVNTPHNTSKESDDVSLDEQLTALENLVVNDNGNFHDIPSTSGRSDRSQDFSSDWMKAAINRQEKVEERDEYARGYIM